MPDFHYKFPRIETTLKHADCAPFIEWYKKAKNGDRYTYWVGFELEDQNVRRLKDLIWLYAVKGYGLLFQKKKREFEYEYIFVKINYRLNSRWIPSDYPNVARKRFIGALTDGTD